VLAQLSSTGQMTAVSSANLSAYLTGVLSAQGASVSILNNVRTPNVAGATFFVAYGPDGTTMINTGVNRSAVSVPGSLACIPRAPQTGWWWNPLEDQIGGTSAARSFSGNWWSYGNGQTLTGPWRQNARTNSNVAPVTITFSGPDTALMTLPNGRTTNLKRSRQWRRRSPASRYRSTTTC
jgi:hypothetical protein